jgi:hypothetical protein
MTSHLGTLLDWTVADFAFLGIAIQQYISVSRDLKRTKAREAAETASTSFCEQKEAKKL